MLTPGEKFFELDMHHKIDRVSIDRLKPAYVESLVTENENDNNTSSETVRDSSTHDLTQTENDEQTDTDTPQVGGTFDEIDFPPLPQPLFPRRRGRPTRQEMAERAANFPTTEQPPVTITPVSYTHMTLPTI